MKNQNKKGFTLVEVLVASMIFAIATTGFCMCAAASMKAQTKSKKRMDQTNKQTTVLESYSGAVDFGAAAVNQLYPGGDNKFKMEYAFDEGTITYDKMYGYQSKYTDEDQVLQLGFFSSDDQLPLGESERWVILKNLSGEDVDWHIESDAAKFSYFNNEKNSMLPTNATNGLRADQEDLRFGVEKLEAGTEWTDSITITVNDEEGHDHSVDLNLEEFKDSDNICRIYYRDYDEYWNDSTYKDWLAGEYEEPEAEESEEPEEG